MYTLKRLVLITTMSVVLCSQSAAQNNCLDFDGTNDYVDIPFQNLSGTSQLTLEAWVNADDITSAPYFEIIRQNSPSTPSAWLLSFQNAGTLLSFGVNTTAGYVEVDVSINAGTYVGSWHHVAGVYDGTSMTMYVDGSIVGTAAQSGTMVMSPNSHRIGTSTTTSELFNGRIDEVRIWNDVRTMAEITSNMNCAITSSRPGLIAVYNLNSTSGITAADSSGNSFHGTLMNGPIWVTSTVAPVCPNGLEEDIVDLQISVYPNPFTDFTVIEFECPSNETYTCCLYNSQGQLIKVLSDIRNGRATINREELSSGIYSFQLSNDTQTIGRGKLVVQH